MTKTNKSYPYPVLGIGDDVLPKPSLNILPITADKDFYFIHVVVEMDNEDIDNLVQNGYAEYGCEVECSRTFYMKWFGFKTKDFTIALPKNSVASKVTFDCRISVIKNIIGYHNRRFHPDYEGADFNLSPGSILATFGKFFYDAEIEYNRLHSAGSFLTIIEGNHSECTTYVLEHPKIEVKLPPLLFKEYKEKYNKKTCKWADIFHSSIAYNALIYALLSYDEEAHGELLWAKTIKYRINLEPSLKQYKDALTHKSPQELVLLAQALLGNPYNRMFKTINSINNFILSSGTEQESEE